MKLNEQVEMDRTIYREKHFKKSFFFNFQSTVFKLFFQLNLKHLLQVLEFNQFVKFTEMITGPCKVDPFKNTIPKQEFSETGITVK